MALVFMREGFEQSNATRMSVARDATAERNIYFANDKMQTNPSHSAIKNSHPEGWEFFILRDLNNSMLQASELLLATA